MKKIVWVMLLLLLGLGPHSASGAPLTIVMDDYPPFSYKENGQVKGLCTQVVQAALQEAGLEATITQYPFVRAYLMTQEEENVFEYCVTRSPQREKLFQWVGIVGAATQGVVALKSSKIRIRAMEDLRRYTIGTVFEDVVDQYLRGKQPQFGLRLDRVGTYDLNTKKLFGKRFELWGGHPLTAMHFAQKLGYSAQDIELVYVFKEISTDFYLVTGLKSSPELVQKLRTAFDTIHRNGVYQKIVDNFFLSKEAGRLKVRLPATASELPVRREPQRPGSN